MDGFYVAKFQKLSDKRPCEEDEENMTDENKMEEIKDEEDKDEIDWAKEVEKVTKKSQKGQKKNQIQSEKQVQKENNKNKRKVGDIGVKGDEKKMKSNHISMPPKKIQKKGKKATNAKVTKPRRRKPQSEI